MFIHSDSGSQLELQEFNVFCSVEEWPNPVNCCFTLEVMGKNENYKEISCRLLAVFWILENFRGTTGKLILVRQFLQLKGYFLLAQMKALTGDLCIS